MSTEVQQISATTTLPLALLVAGLEQAKQAACYVEISSPELAELAGSEIADLRKLWKQLDGKRQELKRPFLDGCEGIDGFFREALDKIKAADTAIAAGLRVYNTEQQRLAAEANAKAQREAAERQRAAKAEAEKQQAEARERAAAADRQRREIEAAALERQRALEAEADTATPERVGEIVTEMVQAEAVDAAAIDAAESERLRALGAEQAAAESVVSAASLVVAVPRYSAPVQTAVAMRDNWTAECVDLWALVKAAAEDKSLLNLLTANETAIRQMAKALKGEMRVPGVVARNEQVVATKKRAA